MQKKASALAEILVELTKKNAFISLRPFKYGVEVHIETIRPNGGGVRSKGIPTESFTPVELEKTIIDLATREIKGSW